MKTVAWTLFWGIVAALAIAIGVAYLGVYNIAADQPHTAPVKWFLGTVMEGSVEHRAEALKAPDLTDQHLIQRGAGHYSEMCVECHLAPGMGDTEIRQGLYPEPPRLADHAPDSPEEAFWIVKHGIKMSGMPAWGKTHDDDKIWAIVAFLEVLPELSEQEYDDIVANAPHEEEGDEHHHEEHGGNHDHG